MRDNFHDPDWFERVSVPVRRVGDRWEFFYGGDVPVREGTVGNLVVSAAAVQDKDFLRRLQMPAVLKVLPEGTPLLVALSDPSRQPCPNRHLIGQIDRHYLPYHPPRLVKVHVGPPRHKEGMRIPGLSEPDPVGGLWLTLKGVDRTELLASSIVMPEDFDERQAYSLNHAFTLLSQRYESHRISHTGNVYTSVFYPEADDRWYPLAELREGLQAHAERRLLAESWKRLEELLGWRPVVRPGRKRRGRTREDDRT